MTRTPATNYREFLRGALDAAWWATTPTPEDDDDSVTFADEAEPADGAEDWLRAVVHAAARGFFVEHYPALSIVARSRAVTEGWAECGHCFILDAEGHGSGFCDRDAPDELCEALADAAREYEGTVNLYVEGGVVKVEPGNVTAPLTAEKATLDPLVSGALEHVDGGALQWGAAWDGLPEPKCYSSEGALWRALSAVRSVRGEGEEVRVGWRVVPGWNLVEHPR